MKKLDIEGLNNDAPNESNRDKQEEDIKFSTKLVDYFSSQVKAFKEDHKDTLTTNQLKKVYCHGAREGKDQGCDNLNLYSLARVLMFIRLKSGGKMTLKSDAPEQVKATKLEMEETQKLIKLSSFIDISESWAPAEEDFEKAQKEMDENDLNHKYEDINDLYLEYQPIEPKWD
jgi:hypothetical protein|tara:strand:+ start:2988 stop:3506 length:519 start_codon:yes stop_codon:yes gene_type:complete